MKKEVTQDVRFIHGLWPVVQIKINVCKLVPIIFVCVLLLSPLVQALFISGVM